MRLSARISEGQFSFNAAIILWRLRHLIANLSGSKPAAVAGSTERLSSATGPINQEGRMPGVLEGFFVL